MITVDSLLAGRYRLTALLGSGGMADVYTAHDELLERPVAVKVLRGSVADHGLRFTSEMRVLSQLSHPGIVHLFDAGEHDDTPFLVMELVSGRPLSDRLAEGPLTPAEAADLGRALAGALAHAHGLGIVHRDVKPANVLLDRDGRVRLTDFGIAQLSDATRLTVTGTTMGTAAYIAPEQLRGERVGPAADVYSLGLVLLEALTGDKEFDGTPVEAAMARLSRDPRVADELPAPWPGLLRAMTDADPARRPSAAEVRGVLGGRRPVAERADGEDAQEVQDEDVQDEPAAGDGLVAAVGGLARTLVLDRPQPDRPQPDRPQEAGGGQDTHHVEALVLAPLRRAGPLVVAAAALLLAALVVVALTLFAREVTQDPARGPAEGAERIEPELREALDRLERSVQP